ncbi:MAG: amphi-Trp domain-containing protein [Thermoplasmatota archaeon]
MTEIPGQTQKQRHVITKGDIECNVYLNKNQIADFLISLAEQLKKGDDLTIKTQEWEIPFSFREPIELEIEFEGKKEKELEIELTFKGKRSGDAPQIS